MQRKAHCIFHFLVFRQVFCLYTDGRMIIVPQRLNRTEKYDTHADTRGKQHVHPREKRIFGFGIFTAQPDIAEAGG